MLIVALLVAFAVVVLLTANRQSGEADELADEMLSQLEDEQKFLDAYERLTK